MALAYATDLATGHSRDFALRSCVLAMRLAEVAGLDDHTRRNVTAMVTILCALVSIFEFRMRSRVSLELELIALRHQVTILRRQRPGRPQLSSLDRLLWMWLYRILAAGHRRDGIGQAGDRDPMASQGLPALLAVAIVVIGSFSRA
jgi:hypothetical protein